MARTKRRSTRRAPDPEPRVLGIELNPEIKRGMLVVLLFALAALMFLAFFEIGGTLGSWIHAGLSSFFGFDRFLVPLILIMIGATIAYPERGTFSAWNYLGLFFFFLSFNATLNLLLVNRPEPFTQDLSVAGGLLGQFLGLLLPHFVGYWGAIILVLALLLVSIMLVFNTSLRSLMGWHVHVIGLFAKRPVQEDARLHLDLAETLEQEEEEDEDEEELEEDIEIQTAPAHSGFRASPVHVQPEPETVVASRSHRQITPPLSLLDHSSTKAQAGDIERNKQIIEKTFVEFGIHVEMGDTAVGPTVTQYTLRPAQGVKISRIVGLQNDLALALAAHPIRMEAPIPGKSLVGIEVPNTKVATVSLRDLLESKNFKDASSPLSLALGKDVSGHAWVVPLEKMPHMLVAGATGSGKSVCLNTIILSLIYQNGPDDLKLILVDPKRVELTAYAGIPHLLVPPITGVDDTVNALKWTVREMERRLDLLGKFGARNIDDYNARVEDRMPKIVVIIDELADLMTSSGREVEGTIVRIAQMARAVGIHLVLATQRPSVDVITGLIKANIPGRIAFAVASQTDSRTILDQSGAEKLLGRGDMLFSSAELAKPKRLQGAYVSSAELERIVSFLKDKGEPDYNMAITEITKAGTVFDNSDDSDPLMEECVQVVLQSGKASTSLLQRRLRIGYGRAARIMDLLEEAGVIGPADGAKPREVLISEWPPGGDLKDGMPTAEDDYEEAHRFGRKNDQDTDIDNTSVLDKQIQDNNKEEEDDSDDVDWEKAVDEHWYRSK